MGGGVTRWPLARVLAVAPMAYPMIRAISADYSLPRKDQKAAVSRRWRPTTFAARRDGSALELGCPRNVVRLLDESPPTALRAAKVVGRQRRETAAFWSFRGSE